MFRRAFADELVRCIGPGFTKVAREVLPDHLLSRMAVSGALAGGTMHGVDSISAGLTADPYDGPQQSAAAALGKGAVGGLLAALGIKAIGAIAGRAAKKA